MSYRYGSPEDANWAIGVDKIGEMVSMCGGALKNFENFYLLRRSNYVSVVECALSNCTFLDNLIQPKNLILISDNFVLL